MMELIFYFRYKFVNKICFTKRSDEVETEIEALLASFEKFHQDDSAAIFESHVRFEALSIHHLG